MAGAGFSPFRFDWAEYLNGITMKRFLSLLRLYPIPVIFAILVSGFFVSYIVFEITGGGATDFEYFGGPSLLALSVVLLTYVAARRFYVWSRKPMKNGSERSVEQDAKKP